MNTRPLCVLVGLTATGKKTVGLRVAKRIGAEIISLDSMKIYRGMDIGTAKPTPKDRAAVRFHLLDLLDPSEAFSAGRFLSLARDAVDDIASRGRRTLFLGGTAFYLNALLHGLIEGVGLDPGLRRLLLERAEREGPERLHGELGQADPESARKIHPHDLKRIVRALEVIEITGEPLSRLKATRTRRFVEGPFRVAGLRRPEGDLKERIALRTRKMFDKGLVDEVKRILDGRGFGPESAKAIGYREVIACCGGEITLEEAEERINLATRRFSRKQAAWYRRFEEVRWFEITEGIDPDGLADEVAAYFTSPEEGAA